MGGDLCRTAERGEGLRGGGRGGAVKEEEAEDVHALGEVGDGLLPAADRGGSAE